MRVERVADFAAYIAVALVLALTVIAFAERDIDVKWLSLPLETGLVFGYVIAHQKRRWRLPRFWLLCFLLLVLHLGIFALVLIHIEKVRAFWVGGLFFVETSALNELLDRLPVRQPRVRGGSAEAG